jgi:hypothetical protein
VLPEGRDRRQTNRSAELEHEHSADVASVAGLGRLLTLSQGVDSATAGQSRVAVAVAVVAGGRDQVLDLGLGQYSRPPTSAIAHTCIEATVRYAAKLGYDPQGPRLWSPRPRHDDSIRHMEARVGERPPVAALSETQPRRIAAGRTSGNRTHRDPIEERGVP